MVQIRPIDRVKILENKRMGFSGGKSEFREVWGVFGDRLEHGAHNLLRGEVQTQTTDHKMTVRDKVK